MSKLLTLFGFCLVSSPPVTPVWQLTANTPTNSTSTACLATASTCVRRLERQSHIAWTTSTPTTAWSTCEISSLTTRYSVSVPTRSAENSCFIRLQQKSKLMHARRPKKTNKLIICIIISLLIIKTGFYSISLPHGKRIKMGKKNVNTPKVGSGKEKCRLFIKNVIINRTKQTLCFLCPYLELNLF